MAKFRCFDAFKDDLLKGQYNFGSIGADSYRLAFFEEGRNGALGSASVEAATSVLLSLTKTNNPNMAVASTSANPNGSGTTASLVLKDTANNSYIHQARCLDVSDFTTNKTAWYTMATDTVDNSGYSHLNTDGTFSIRSYSGSYSNVAIYNSGTDSDVTDGDPINAPYIEGLKIMLKVPTGKIIKGLKYYALFKVGTPHTLIAMWELTNPLDLSAGDTLTVKFNGEDSATVSGKILELTSNFG